MSSVVVSSHRLSAHPPAASARAIALRSFDTFALAGLTMMAARGGVPEGGVVMATP